MPEAPELEVVKDFLTANAVGADIQAATIVRPGALRSLCGDMPSDIRGRSLDSVRRRGKFILLDLAGGRIVAINPMLTGALQYCPPKQRVYKRTYLAFALSNGYEIRYLDEKRMGMVYYADAAQTDEIPRLNEQGPDALDGFTFEEFCDRLKRFHGEIKGILTGGKVVSGIGNAYSDEILFAAQIYPFRRRKALSDAEIRRLYDACGKVVLDAIPIVRDRIGDDIHLKVRDFLQVHNKGGKPCPRCGGKISQITANRRITSYCRRCQPGMLLRN